ncbi:MAG TPA: GNAT family N-acetyltransferase [Mucilaginibacter sp.]|jgi:ribosomal protein S18 acetylase RimI-like enzyme|nr:GNAT family N-acetyltransferase [Mucilaginibacter sp.]
MIGSIANSLQLSVKKIAIDDLQLVVNLFDKYRVFYKKESDVALAERFLKERLVNNESVIYVALDAKSPIGFTQLYPKFSSGRAEKNWILNDLYVDENYRKQGIGKKLIDAAINFAKEKNAKFVQLETATDNYNAQHLYESSGFIKQAPDDEFIIYRINVD